MQPRETTFIHLFPRCICISIGRASTYSSQNPIRITTSTAPSSSPSLAARHLCPRIPNHSNSPRCPPQLNQRLYRGRITPSQRQLPLAQNRNRCYKAHRQNPARGPISQLSISAISPYPEYMRYISSSLFLHLYILSIPPTPTTHSVNCSTAHIHQSTPPLHPPGPAYLLPISHLSPTYPFTYLPISISPRLAPYRPPRSSPPH